MNFIVDILPILKGASNEEEVLKFDRNPSELYGKDCIYVSSLTCDSEFMELLKV
jgi:hypothetical protein